MQTTLTPSRRDALIIVVAILASLLYILTARSAGISGFPLDDAWIHQTYARNLIEYGEWSFIPGTPGTGATSMLWPLLLAPAYIMRISPELWTFLVGTATLAGAGLGAARLIAEEKLLFSLLVGLAVVLEWHMVWAANSGMETGLAAALLIWFWLWFTRHDPRAVGHRLKDGFILGLWGGFLMLARPEGIVAAGIVGVYGMLIGGKITDRLRWGIAAGLGLAVIAVPYAAFNLSLNGAILPNTSAAKQAEYAILWQLPYLQRFGAQVFVSMVGPQLLLIPGLLYGIIIDVRQRPVRWTFLLPLIWVIAHWGLFAARLPVTYQHGRYAIPVIPLLVVYGIRGAAMLARPRSRQVAIRFASLIWLGAAALLFPAMLIALGAPAYANDIGYIDDEMVATAAWIEANTESDALIAVHDIGALGYFAPHPLLDLAGLVSPDVIPFMTDDIQLTAYIFDEGADYLIVFPDWSPAYRRMVADPRLCLVWSADQEPDYISRAGTGAMSVYSLLSEGETCPD